MSEIQWPHTLHLSLNLRKSDVLVYQTRASGLGCNNYISNSECSGSKIRSSECSNSKSLYHHRYHFVTVFDQFVTKYKHHVSPDLL
jgi:hypothetical protein